jgi:putative signal transducing protein
MFAFLSPKPVGSSIVGDESVTVAQVSSRIEADLVAGLLRSEGISARVNADDAGGQEPQLQLQSGAQVLVAAADEARAREILAEFDRS